MGAWGVESFENDDALDWLADLEQADDEQFLVETLTAAIEEAGYLEVGVASNAIAAAEVVATLAGRPAPNLPKVAVAWAATHAVPDPGSLVALALGALDRIERKSELASLWVEGYAELWLAAVAELRTRLGAEPPPRGT
jgi:hypothetical protein